MFKALVVDNSSGVVAASVRDLDRGELAAGKCHCRGRILRINYKTDWSQQEPAPRKALPHMCRGLISQAA